MAWPHFRFCRLNYSRLFHRYGPFFQNSPCWLILLVSIARLPRMFCLYFLTGKFCHLLDPEKIERFERYQRQVQTVFSYYKRIRFLVQVFSDEGKHKRYV